MTDRAATVSRDGDTLRFGGALLRDDVAALWRSLQGDTAGVRTLDLSAVERIDSAGLALVSLLAAGGEGIELHGIAEGRPAGFAELREAYRLGHGLAFVRD
jgi:phospholipid transport system transporter-binding protein